MAVHGAMRGSQRTAMPPHAVATIRRLPHDRTEDYTRSALGHGIGTAMAATEHNRLRRPHRRPGPRGADTRAMSLPPPGRFAVCVLRASVDRGPPSPSNVQGLGGWQMLHARALTSGRNRSLPWARHPDAAALADPDRGFHAIVIGSSERAPYGRQFATMAPLFAHHGLPCGDPSSARRSTRNSQPTTNSWCYSASSPNAKSPAPGRGPGPP